MPPPEKDKEVKSRVSVRCARSILVHASHYSRLKNLLHRLPTRKDYHVPGYILRVVHITTYVIRTLDSSQLGKNKEEKRKKIEEKKKKRKRKDMKRKKKQDKKWKQGKEKRKKTRHTSRPY